MYYHFIHPKSTHWLRKFPSVVLLVLAIVLGFEGNVLEAQVSPPSDPILLAMLHSEDKKERVDLLNKAAKEHLHSKPGLASNYARKALSIAQETGYTEGEAHAHRQLGKYLQYSGKVDSSLLCFQKALALFEATNNRQGIGRLKCYIASSQYILGEYDTALKHCQSSSAILEEIKDFDGIAEAYNLSGVIYDHQGDYLKALKCYQKALKIQQGLGNRLGIALCYNNLGIIYKNQEDFEQSLSYSTLALDIMEEEKDSLNLASLHNNMGNLHYILRNDVESQKHYLKSQQLSKRMKQPMGEAVAFMNLGQIAASQGNFQEGLEHYFNASTLFTAIGFASGTCDCNTGIARCYMGLKQPKKGLVYGKKSLALSLEINEQASVKKASQILYQLNSELGNYKEAFEHALHYQAVSDSLSTKESIKKAAQVALQNQHEKEVAFTALEQSKRDSIQASNLAKERAWKWIFMVVLLALVGIVTLGAFGYRNLKRSHATIAEQRDQILFLNQNLEHLVRERTAELADKTQTLSDFVFTNSHRVRGPIARILGLLDVHENGGFNSPEELPVLMAYLSRAAKEADGVIHEIGEALEENTSST